MLITDLWPFRASSSRFTWPPLHVGTHTKWSQDRKSKKEKYEELVLSTGSKYVVETMHIKTVTIIKLHYRDKCIYKIVN